MKIKSILLGAFAAMALASCNNADLGGVVEPGQLDGAGNGFISIRVGMPTVSGISRGENDQFHEGTPWEYGVKDVSLMLFTGTSEADATYQQWVKLLDVDFGFPAPSTNVTLDKKYVEKIEGMELEGKKVFALAVINHNKVFDTTSGLKIGGTDIPQGTAFSAIQDIIMNTNINANGAGTGVDAGFQTQDGGILMLNAPLCDQQGTTTTSIVNPKLNILQDVTSSIFASENEAREGKCANIYVERAVAKVTVTHTNKEGDVKDGEDLIFHWDLQAWRLDNTNTKSYVVRNMSNFDDTYAMHSWQNNIRRMVGGVSVKHDTPISAGAADMVDRYRTYFAIDPNYATNGDFNVGTDSKSFGSDVAQYCAENVFDVAHQIWSQTTRVLVSAKLTPGDGDSYYAHPGDDKYLSKTAVKELAFNAAIKVYRAKIEAFRAANLLTGNIVFDADMVALNDVKDEITVTLPTSNITVAPTVTNADVAAAHLDGINTRSDLETALAEINTANATQTVKHSDMGVRYYTGGTSYYQVRIKHFGDELTPWNEAEYEGTNGPTAGMIDNAYPNNEHRNDNYLGRYGVLRNNWYEVNINKVVKIGYPTLDDLKLDGSGTIDPNTPDDHIEKEQWINAEINILSWAKRIQNNDLGND